MHWDYITQNLIRILPNSKRNQNLLSNPHNQYVGYDENKLQETKTRESKRISKVDAKQTHLRRVKSESGT
jgi:hypothetical protein